ncbi:protein-L-isoaspartate(D-aspartate) O-methyltransferase [Candidatus Omnitrophota bacterium]
MIIKKSTRAIFLKLSYCLLSILFVFSEPLSADEEMYTLERFNMIDQQIQQRGVTDPDVIDAMLRVKRHLFLPHNIRYRSYADEPLPIGYGQTISQPYIVAYMTEAAQLKPRYKVLEIGTGSGYQAAVLAEIVREVYTIEILQPLADAARNRLSDLGYTNIKYKHGDGYKGWPEHAPFDAIIVTAAPTTFPEELIGQLKVGGRMVIPMGSFMQELYLVTKTRSGYDRKKLMPVRFVPMVRY